MSDTNTPSTIRWNRDDKARGRWLRRRLALADQAGVARFCMAAVYNVLARGETFPLYGVDAPIVSSEEDEDDA